MHVVVRVDGNHEVGFGHLIRTSTLVTELASRGHEVTYLTQTPDTVSEFAPGPTSVETLADADSDAVAGRVCDLDPDLLFTDVLEADTDYQRRVGADVPTLAVMMDDSRYALRCDLLVNGNLYADELSYDWRGSEPSWCLGTDYLLLRDPFRERLRAGVPWRETAERALVTMGGSDKEGRTPAVMRAFEGSGLDVTVIIGAGFENEYEIREMAMSTAVNFDLRTAVDSAEMACLMTRADLAVSTLGTTVYELFATGTPIIGIPDNDTPIADALATQDAAVVLDRDATTEAVATAVKGLQTDDARRRTLYERGLDLVSPDGPSNLADELVDHTGDG